MIDEQTKKRIMDLCNKPYSMGGWLGLPTEEEACLKFAVKFYKEIGIEADTDALKQARNFVRVKDPQFGDIAVFKGLEFDNKFHIGVMLDYRKAIQCNDGTNGVGKIDISRYPFCVSLKGFYRHESLA